MDDNTTSPSIIVQPPLSFVRSGYVRVDNGSIINVSGRGYYWSRTTNLSTEAYNLYFSFDIVGLSGGSYRHTGQPLRYLDVT